MMQRTVLNKGKLEKSDNKDITLEFPKSSDFFSLPANLITGLSGVSGGRVLLGSKGSLQAISLKNREVPLVQSVAKKTDEAFVQKFGKALLSLQAENDGVVTYVSDDEIHVKPEHGKERIYNIYNHYNLGRKSFLHSIPQVKVGDHVKKGQILGTTNYTDDKGHLALGTNLTTAVMPYRSGNFEDAWVVTESGAKKLEAEQIIKYRIERKFGVETNKGKFVSLFPSKFLSSQLKNIDADGVVKVGTHLEYGDPVILGFAPKALKSTDIQLGKLSRVLKNAYKDASQIWDLEHSGDVVDVSKAGDLITVNIKTSRGLAVGDKVSNVFGAKGVVGDIIPDVQAPTDKDGKPIDIILNSMSITSRVAPALAIALGLGKVAKKLGHPIKVEHFSEGSSIQKTIDTLKKHNIPDTEELYDPITGKHVNVLTGPMYFTRLAHVAEDKQSSRSQGAGYSFDLQPTKSVEESAKRIGNLATTALLSHGATAVLKDIATIKATKNDEYWRRLKLGLPPSTLPVPFIFDKFISHLRGAGVKVDKKDTVFSILPQTDKDVLALSNGAINDPGMFKIRNEKLIPDTGGLFDPAKTGILGDRYNHIDLVHPIPNPISEDFLRKLLKITQKEYDRLVSTGEVVDRIKEVDTDKALAEYTKYLKTGKKSERDNAVKLLSFLKMLKHNKMTPKDLIISKIPIIPLQYRPVMAQGDLTLSADVNNLYKDLILNNRSLKDTTDVPQEIVDRLRLDQYKGAKAVFGLGEPISPKNKEKQLKGLLSTALGIHGGSAKTTMFQSKVVNKPLDLVGRAVLTPDAKLGLDEASIPQDIIWKTYAPFIVRRLVLRGVPAIKALEYVRAQNQLAVNALSEEMKTRPGIISRDPVLHKYNLTGFYLKPNVNPADKTIKLNPLVFKSFNADNDGDQLNVNIPVSDDARQEVIDKMLPSKNLLSPKNFGPIYTPSNESALGLYQASTEHKEEQPIKFKTNSEAIAAFNKGELHPGSLVEIG
jgi:hypothetical protein